MNFLSQMKIKFKLIIGFSFLILINFALAVSTYTNINTLDATVIKADDEAKFLRTVLQYQNNAKAAEQSLFFYIAKPESVHLNNFQKAWETKVNLSKTLDSSEFNVNEIVKQRFLQSQDKLNAWHTQIAAPAIDLVKNKSDKEQAMKLLSSRKGQSLWQEFFESITSASNSIASQIQLHNIKQQKSLKMTSYVAIGGALFLLVICVIIASSLILSINKPLGHLVDVTNHLRKGNWDIDIALDKRGDEIGELGVVFSS